jgi:hypothetical protein
MANPNPSPSSRFKAGSEWNGNAKGRPPGRSLTGKLRDLLASTTFDGEPIEDGKCVADLVAEALIRLAIGGHFRAMVEILNRTEGRVRDRVEEPAQGRVAVVWEAVEDRVARVYARRETALAEVETN